MLKPQRKESNIFEIARPWPNIWPEWPHAITAQCVPQIGPDQCGGACLIPICGPDPSAEASAQGVDHFEIARPQLNICQDSLHFDGFLTQACAEVARHTWTHLDLGRPC
jgi:hypothetical protein